VIFILRAKPRICETAKFISAKSEGWLYIHSNIHLIPTLLKTKKLKAIRINLQTWPRLWHSNNRKTCRRCTAVKFLQHRYIIPLKHGTHIKQSLPNRKHRVSITKTNRLIMFRNIIAVYYENRKKHASTLRGQNAVSYH
jgi:hypothetical protein